MSTPIPPASDNAPEAARSGTARTRSQSAFGRTVAMATGQPVATAHHQGATVPDAVEPPAVVQPAVPGNQHWLEAGDVPGTRFALGEALGTGSTGIVHAVYDAALDRKVALKILGSGAGQDDRRSAFLNEARLTAAIQHPGVLPVFDLGLTGGGQPYFSMGRLEGISLGEVVRASRLGSRHPRIAAINAVVSIAIALCQVVGYAHRRRIVHQDIKPDNIFLGEFGEVLLLDWGCAVRLGDRSVKHSVYGTPLYMSPEQSRNESSDERSDQYCLGATLFHLLILRLPTWHGDNAVFWQKKRTGVIDPIDPGSRKLIPTPLIEIVLKAMAADPNERYASIDIMRRDLENFQAGLAVTAHRESLLQTAGRWYRHNRKLSWVGAVAAVAVAGLGYSLWHDRQLENAAWRQVHAESFKGATPVGLSGLWSGVARDWTAAAAEMPSLADPTYFTCSPEGLTLTAHSGYTEVLYTCGVLGNLRVEWDAEVLDQALNLNCFVGSRNREHSYLFSIGGWDDPSNCVLTYGTQAIELSQTTATPVVANHWYHFVLERVDRRICLRRDGETLFDLLTPDDLDPGDQVFGFDTCNGNRLRISGLVISAQPLAERISPLAVGDKLFRLADYKNASAQYQEIRDAYHGSGLDLEAEYRMALCALRLGDNDRGLALLDDFEKNAPGHRLLPYALHERWRVLAARGDRDDRDNATHLAKHLADANADPTLLRAIYSELIVLRRPLFESHSLVPPGTPVAADPLAQPLAALHEIDQYAALCRVASRDSELVRAATQFLRYHDRDDLVLANFADNRPACALSLLNQGKYDEVLEKFHDLSVPCSYALEAQAKWADILAGSYPPDVTIEALARTGHLDDALARFPGSQSCGDWLIRAGRAPEAITWLAGNNDLKALALSKLGKPEDGLAVAQSPYVRAPLLITMKRYDEAMALLPQDLGIAWSCAIGLRRDGNAAAARVLEARLATADINHDRNGQWFAGYIMPRVMAVLDGGGKDWSAQFTAIMDKHRTACGQRLWHGLALLTGAEDVAAFQGQPYQLGVKAYAEFLQGVKADLHGDAAGALAHYRAVAAWDDREVQFEYSEQQFLAWRLAVLADGGAGH